MNADGVLTLTSVGATATLGEWQAALRAVTYENTSDTPDATQRLVDFVVSDGISNGNTLTSMIDISATNDASVLADTEIDPLLYAPHAAATVITTTLSLTDLDTADMTGATIQITSGYQAGDVLGFTNTPNITGIFNAGNGTLTLTGTDTTANYQAALRTVTYISSSPSAAPRTVSFQVNDGTDPGNIETRTVGGFAQLSGGTVNVYGTPQVDMITVTDSGPLQFVVNGVVSQFDGDLLLSGSSTFETDPTILQALLAEWASGNSYQSRADHLLGNTGGGANTTFTLNPSTVNNDAQKDYLTGNGGQDWFLANSLQDVLTDNAVDEIFTHIDAWI